MPKKRKAPGKGNDKFSVTPIAEAKKGKKKAKSECQCGDACCGLTAAHALIQAASRQSDII